MFIGCFGGLAHTRVSNEMIFTCAKQTTARRKQEKPLTKSGFSSLPDRGIRQCGFCRICRTGYMLPFRKK
jgi:hypothetical protein